MPGSEIPNGGSNQLSRDEKFLQSIDRFIESNLSNDQFGVEQLADLLNISRTQLFRRLQKLTGKNISQYLREYRLKKALELLKKDVASASEIAYQVGFSSPSYFNKCFHDHFGISPGQVNKSKENIESNETPSESYKEQNHTGYSGQKQSIWHRKNFVYLLFILAGILIASITIGYLIKNDEKSLPTTLNPKNTIAVLPFKNDSPDLSNEHLCNGFLEDLLTHLENISDLSVKSRQSVEKYRDNPADPREVGKELNVNYLLEGSFRRVADSIRVTVQLIDANTGDHIWADTYDGPLQPKFLNFKVMLQSTLQVR